MNYKPLIVVLLLAGIPLALLYLPLQWLVLDESVRSLSEPLMSGIRDSLFFWYAAGSLITSFAFLGNNKKPKPAS